MKITLLILAALEVASGSPSLSVVDVHVPLPEKITTVTHKKHANGGYKKGSPLYNKQERLEAKEPKQKQPLVATLPKQTEAPSAQPYQPYPRFNFGISIFTYVYLINFSVYAFFVLVVAYVYEKNVGSIMRKEKLTASPEDLPAWTRCGFSFSLFDCGNVQTDWPICLTAYCCPIVLWASTASKTTGGDHHWSPFMGYWKAVILLLVLVCLGPFTFGMTLLVILLILLKRRRELRKGVLTYYGADMGFRSWMEDICLIFCCNGFQCCQLVQEAREVYKLTPDSA